MVEQSDPVHKVLLTRKPLLTKSSRVLLFHCGPVVVATQILSTTSRAYYLLAMLHPFSILMFSKTTSTMTTSGRISPCPVQVQAYLQAYSRARRIHNKQPCDRINAVGWLDTYSNQEQTKNTLSTVSSKLTSKILVFPSTWCPLMHRINHTNTCLPACLPI